MPSGSVARNWAVCGIAVSIFCVAVGAAIAGDLRELSIGTRAAEMPPTGYFEHACGSNGGPPLKKISGWADFARCAPDEKGLFEIYVEYDDQDEYGARLIEEFFDHDEFANLATRKYGGTKVAGHPVVLSVLFDREGVVQAIRAVTDPRAPLQFRRNGYLLRVPIKANYGTTGWACDKLPLAPGETPVGEMSIKEHCEKMVGDRRMVLETQLYRRPGQTGVNGAGERADGDFWSSGRWEIWAAKPAK